jgi:DNA-binding CsgD family transcriptional regulator
MTMTTCTDCTEIFHDDWGKLELSLWLVDLDDFTVRAVSEAAVKRTGVPASEYVGRPVVDHLRVEGWAGTQAALEAMSAGVIERHLRKIAAEVDASGILQSVQNVPEPARFPELGDLSARQWEVLSHLMRGERVPAIAAALFVSQSTVRNHLSAIFGRFGVHSQVELLALLLRPGEAPR